MTASTRRCVSTAALVVLALASTLPARAQGADDIYAKAKSEGAFVLYVGGPTAPWEATARLFEQRYPGIKVSITGGFSNVLDKKIDQQITDNKLEVDTAIFQTLQDFVRWKAEGRLLPYKPPGFDAIDPSFKDADGAFYGVMVNTMPYMYNTQQVAAADVPNSALDFLKAQFKGRMVTPYPADDDATLWLFHKIVLKYGWDYMDKYMANKPNFIQGHLPAAQHRVGAELGDVRFDLQHHRSREEGGQTGGVAFLHDRRDADLAAYRRDLQGRAASERGKALPRLAHGAGAAGRDRHLVVAQGRAAAQGLQADLRLPGRQRLPQLSGERAGSDRAAQTLRSLYRTRGERRRGAIGRRPVARRRRRIGDHDKGHPRPRASTPSRISADVVGVSPSPQPGSPNVPATCSSLPDGHRHDIGSRPCAVTVAERRQDAQSSGRHQGRGHLEPRRQGRRLRVRRRHAGHRSGDQHIGPGSRGARASGLPQYQADRPIGGRKPAGLRARHRVCQRPASLRAHGRQGAGRALGQAALSAAHHGRGPAPVRRRRRGDRQRLLRTAENVSRVAAWEA